MPDGDAAEFLAFEHVRVLKSAAGALRCMIGGKRVWLPREHIKGTLWCPGDGGTLLVRRWIALDRHLVLPDVSRPVRLACQPVPRVRPSRPLHLVRSARITNGH